MNTAPDRQTLAKRNKLPWNSNVAVNRGRYLMIMKAQDHKSVIQNETPKFFNFSGIISEMTKNGSVNTAHDAMKITNEKLAIGIQLYDSTWYPHVFSIMYTPIVMRPIAVPTVDTTNKN